MVWQNYNNVGKVSFRPFSSKKFVVELLLLFLTYISANQFTQVAASFVYISLKPLKSTDDWSFVRFSSSPSMLISAKDKRIEFMSIYDRIHNDTIDPIR